MDRVRVYVDGFNFYYAVKHGSEDGEFPIGLGWCDFRKLAERHMVGPNAVVDQIKYFTAPVTSGLATSAGEERRQSTWLDAVRTIPGLEVIRGFHQQHDWKPREEKQTDINIAVELLVDAMNGAFTRAILITADVDQVPAVRAARERLPGRQVEVDLWLPPGARAERWKREAQKLGVACREITLEMLATSRLPDRIVTKAGTVVTCLEEWKMPTGLGGLRWSQIAP
jgi:hypothetical protein